MAAERNSHNEIAWRRSSASNTAGDCVEVAVQGRFVLIRDSHDKQGGVLKVVPERWCEFLDYVRSRLIDAASGRQSAEARPGR